MPLEVIPRTAIQSHGGIDCRPREIYGNGDIILRIGNGGAGATGVIRALATDYLSTIPDTKAITWVCNHSRNTQLALLHGSIDIGLTYERDQEELASTEGWSVTSGPVFHDHFCLAGPVSDPAGVKHAKSLQEGLGKIAVHGALFHSRADDSATMYKERSLWRTCGLAPWEGLHNEKEWYKMSEMSPADALKAADTAAAYIVTDRSTLLQQTSLKSLHRTTVFFEPESPIDSLMNTCCTVYSVSAQPLSKRITSNFIQYLASNRAQEIIETFGVRESGLPFFAPISQGCADSRLQGGVPRNGRWVQSVQVL